jgi:leucyl aminopeptidase (aminopeptidase T)
LITTNQSLLIRYQESIRQMKPLSCHSAIALSALLLGACGGANSVVGPSSVQMHDGSTTAAAATSQTEGAKKAAWNALSDADKAAKKAAMQARRAAWDALSDGEKAAKRAARPLRKSMMGGKKAAWNALSDADKAAKKVAMQARKTAWDALSDADKATKRARRMSDRAIVVP